MNKNLETQYDKFATSFVDNCDDYNRYANEVYHDLLDFDMNGRRLLDLGCGGGNDLEIFAEKGAEVHGIDSSKEMVALSKKRIPGADVMEGFMESLPYGGCSFDIVLSKYVLQTSTNIPRVLAEMGRVLKPGGIMTYLSVHPTRQFLEAQRGSRDYFTQSVVDSVFFEGRITVQEPTHTIGEYLNEGFLEAMELLRFEEYTDFPSVKKIDGDIYPCFFIVKAKKKTLDH